MNKRDIYSFTSANLDYKIYIPQNPLSAILLQLVEIKGIPGFNFERILPFKHPRIIVNLGGLMRAVFNFKEEGLQSFETVLQGSQSTYYDSFLPLSSHFFIIDFHPGLVREISCFEPRELLNKQVINPSLKNFESCRERIINACNFNERIKITENWMLRFAWKNLCDPLTEFIDKSISENPFQRLKDIESATGYTRKYLTRRFKDRTGFPISSYRRMTRFQRVMSKMRSNGFHDWFDFILDAEYYDQSHFIKDVKEFSGLTPTQLAVKVKSDYNLNLRF